MFGEILLPMFGEVLLRNRQRGLVVAHEARRRGSALLRGASAADVLHGIRTHLNSV